MSFIQEHADAASVALAAERGVFPAWHGSIYDPASGDDRGGPRYRNSTRTTVAPTGTLSIIADCSGGIEPAFALAFMRQHYLDRKDPTKADAAAGGEPDVPRRSRSAKASTATALIELPGRGRHARGARRRAGVGEARLRHVARHRPGVARAHAGGVPAPHRQRREQDDQLPRTRRPSTDVERAYLLAYREGCKGITVYRDGSREQQVLSHATARGPEQAEAVAAEIAMGVGELIARRCASGAAGVDGAAAGGRAVPPAPAGRAAVDHAQVPRRRAGGLHHGRACTTTARRARSSSTSRRRARRSAD